MQTDTYTYDKNGNRLTKQAVVTGQTTTQQTTYSYDFENRLNKLTYVNIPGITGTQTDLLTYNGEGLRTQVNLNNVTTGFQYDGSNVLIEKNSSGSTTKTYTRGLDFGGGIGSLIAQNTTGTGAAVRYYDYNDLGSVANTTTSSGAATSSYSYDAFGNQLTPQITSDTNRYLFSTKEFDSRSGLDYFGARYYDPEIGRWLTPDPLGMVDGPNTYLYVNNNPVNLVDPYGLVGVVLTGNPGTLNLNDVWNSDTQVNLNVPITIPIGNPASTANSGQSPNNPQAPTVPMSAPSNDCGGKENAQDCADIFSKDSNGNTVGNGNNYKSVGFKYIY